MKVNNKKKRTFRKLVLKDHNENRQKSFSQLINFCFNFNKIYIVFVEKILNKINKKENRIYEDDFPVWLAGS